MREKNEASLKINKRKKLIALSGFTISIVILSTTLLTKKHTIDPVTNPTFSNTPQTDQSSYSTPTSEKVNGIYGNKDFVVDYELIDGVYVYNNPDNLDPNQWYSLHQYYPTNYGYGGEEFSVPKNISVIDSYKFQFGEVFSYPSNYFATLISLNGKMYLKNFDNIPSTSDLRGFLRQINTISH